jgi:hypothetical protein
MTNLVAAFRRRIFVSTLAALATAALTSCANEPDLVGTWELTREQNRVAGAEWSDSDVPCVLGNKEEFGEDGAWALYDVAPQCDPNSAESQGISYGQWELKEDGTTLVLTYDFAPGEYLETIESLTETELIRTFAVGDLDGTETRRTFRRVE